MIYKIFENFVLACLISVSFNANAVILNTLNGTDYQWLELTATEGLTRNQVDLRLIDSNDILYGYEYASRTLLESLFLSYSSWDGISGFHGASNVLAGSENLINDFGTTYTDSGNGVNTNYTTVDVGDILYDGYTASFGLYGTKWECGYKKSCFAVTSLYTDTAGNNIMVSQNEGFGWDSTKSNYNTRASDNSYFFGGSYLVRTSASVVPVPAAVWLFSSGLLGLAGVARIKKSR